MSKRKRNVPGGQTNNSQKSKEDRIDDLLKDEKERRKAELLSDEKVAAKLNSRLRITRKSLKQGRQSLRRNIRVKKLHF